MSAIPAAKHPLQENLLLPCGLRLRNRLAKSATTEGLAQHGQPTAALGTLYARWAKAGFGLLVTGNVQIALNGLERPGNVLLDHRPSAAALTAYRAWAEAARSEGAAILMQLSHAGRQTPARVCAQPEAPSPVPLDLPGRFFGRPIALTDTRIRFLVQGFAMAAAVAQEAGFHGVQLHAAHGYLISQFLNPLANRRTDAWGGSLEARARFLLETVDAVRVATGPGFAISVKLNASDFRRGGFNADDSLRVARWLEAAGVDLLEISGGSYEQPAMLGLPGIEVPSTESLAEAQQADAYFLTFVRSLVGHRTPPLMLTGGLRRLDAMRHVRDIGIDIIGIARPACVDIGAVSGLLSGTITELPRAESRLRIGPMLLGPFSSSHTLKMLNGFAVLACFNQALRSLATGAEPRLVHPLVALWKELLADLRSLRQVRRMIALRARASTNTLVW